MEEWIEYIKNTNAEKLIEVIHKFQELSTFRKKNIIKIKINI